MIEPYQILLFIVISVLTVLMVIIGWQIFLIFSELRKILAKFNTMADGAVSITGNIGRSLHNLTGFTTGLKTIFNIARIFKRGGEKENIQHE